MSGPSLTTIIGRDRAALRTCGRARRSRVGTHRRRGHLHGLLRPAAATARAPDRPRRRQRRTRLGEHLMVARTKTFAWDKFFLVGKWTLLSYVIAAGLIEFAFVRTTCGEAHSG